jgi:3-phosphoshikimate 1-carboxyvinyltransferase
VSSSISALLLVAPKLQDGIEITLVGEITSVYIKMTLALLNDLDIKTSFEGNVITVYQNKK